MSRFAQQTRLVATRGQVGALLAKFVESAEIQQDNPACELMIVGRSTTEQDVVYVIEVWTSEQAWDAARTSGPITAWAGDLTSLVAEPPVGVELDGVVGKGLRTRAA